MLVKIAKKICPLCVHKTLNTISILTHTSHLTVDLSHTCAPPHLIKALRATTGWSKEYARVLKDPCLVHGHVMQPYYALKNNAWKNSCCARANVMKLYVPWAFVGKFNPN